MREIKFSYIIKHNETGLLVNLIFEFTEIENGLVRKLLFEGGTYANYSIVARRQYTNKQDKNGRDIYEGDIIEFDEREWGGTDNIHVVSWDEKYASWNWGGGTSSDMEWRKVIGNIHKNPEPKAAKSKD